MFTRYLPYFLVIFLSIPTFSSLLRPGFFPMHDNMQVMRVYQMDKCFSDLQIPCRWVPDMGYGYGYPQFNYYGPLPYYYMEVSHLLGLNFLDSVKLGFVTPLLLSGLFMYFLARKMWGKMGGLLSAAMYIYAPYRASDVYSRGAMGETWAFMFMPLILYFSQRIISKQKTKDVAFFAISLACLLCSHNITSLIFLPLASIFVFVNIILSKDRPLIKKKILLHLSGTLWSVAIAGFFFLPVVFEQQYAHTESMISGYFNYLAHFININQLFFTSFWGRGSSVLGPTDELSFFTSPVTLLLLVVTVTIALSRLRSRNERPTVILGFTLVLIGLISLYMTHSKSSFIWQRVGVLKYLQFPWRFLTLSTFFFSLACGFPFVTLQKNVGKYLLLTVISIVFLTNAAFFRPDYWIETTQQEKLSGQQWDKQMTISIFDYLPIYAKFPPVFVAPISPEVISGDTQILRYTKKSNLISFSAISQKPSTIRVPQFDFPGWTVWTNGKKTIHNHNNELGLTTFILPAGTNEVVLRLQNTPIRTFGNFLTFMGLTAVVLVFLYKPKHAES